MHKGNFMLEKETKLLFDCIIKQQTIDKTVQEIFENIFDNPVMVSNSYFKVLSMYSDIEFTDHVWNYAQQYNCCSKESIESFRDDEASIRLFNTNKSFIYSTNLGSVIPRILGRIDHEDTIYGFLIVFEVKHKLTELDIEKANLVCDALSVILSSKLNPTTKYEYFFRQLLELDDHNRLEVENELAQNRATYKPFFKVISTKKETKQYDAYATYVCQEINQLNESVYAMMYKKGIIVIVNFEDDNELTRCLDFVGEILKQNNMPFGMSMTFQDVLRLKYYGQQAIKARELGQIIDPGEHVYRYSKYILFGLMTKCDQNELYTLICKEYTKLKEYDIQNDSDYVNTCITYYLSGSNVSKTSNELFIHRNTLFYRLKHIEKIADMSMENVEILAMIYHSRLIDRWIQIKYG